MPNLWQAQGYDAATSDEAALAAFCEKHGVDVNTLELRRTGGAVLVRVREGEGESIHMEHKSA